MLINFLVRALQSTECLILDLFCQLKYEKKILKITALSAEATQTVKFLVLKCGLWTNCIQNWA